MDPKKFAPKKGPEAKIQEAIIKRLKHEDWFVQVIHGNTFQNGLPDLFCAHNVHGHRWVEVKNPVAFKFTPKQLEKFPKLCAYGSGVWVLVSDSDEEYKKLFGPPNWFVYLSIMRGWHR